MAPDGHRQILSFLLTGDLISVANLFDPMLGHSVDAITDVTYARIKRRELKALVFASPALLEKLCNIWIDERARADELAVNIGRKSAHARIAGLILGLAKRLIRTETIDGQKIDFPLRQYHIANATGLTHIYVGKVLGELLRAGFIEIGDRSLRINDKVELSRLAGWN